MTDKIETRGSTMFTDISYDGKQLTVSLINGTEYRYTIPQRIWLEFKKASSYGHFYNERIKPTYQYERTK